MPFIKSYSNYVLKKKHQDVSDGTIYERDITTIGGTDRFSPGQIPLYRSGNFIFTVNGEKSRQKDVSTTEWEPNSSGSYIWKATDIETAQTNDDRVDEERVVLRQDYYDLRDFAYYGSLSELIRVSMNNIISNFVGEMFISSNDTAYTYTDPNGDDHKIGEDGDYFTVDNPFFIDIVSEKVPGGADEIKFFAESGYTRYSVISRVGVTYNVTGYSFTANTMAKSCPGYFIGEGELKLGLETHPTDKKISISAYYGTDLEILYCVGKDAVEFANSHVRPKEEYLSEFSDRMTSFEKLFINGKTNPKYLATFIVIKENEYGYYKELETFQLPTRVGGFNIDMTQDYVDSLMDIAVFYDERFCDNLWRSMTHEAIKNFDWTHEREYEEGDAEENIIGGERLKKALAIMAREFDEIKSYIDAINDVSRITYDKRSNLPDYFIKSSVATEGWDARVVIPFTLTEKDLDGNVVPSAAYADEDAQLNGVYNGTMFRRYFSQDTADKIFPYQSGNLGDMQYGYVRYYECEGGMMVEKTKKNEESYEPFIFADDTPYYTNKAYSNDSSSMTMSEVSTEFMRRLKLNSRYILRKKGTIEGIESLLAMFGLRSSRMDNEGYDYSVTEYSTFAYKIEEKWDPIHQMYRDDFINKTKTIVYDHRSDNGGRRVPSYEYVTYQGLPVAYRYADDDEEGGRYLECGTNNPTDDKDNAYRYNTDNPRDTENYVRRRFLYPSYTNPYDIDGGVYYQMNGGWIDKRVKLENPEHPDPIPFTYNQESDVVYSTDESEPLFTETYRNILGVDTLDDLMKLTMADVHDKEIVQVRKMENTFAVVDGMVYPVMYEYVSSDDAVRPYIPLYVQSHAVSVGDAYITDDIKVYDSSLEEHVYSLIAKESCYEIKAFINEDADIQFIAHGVTDAYETINSFMFFKDSDNNGYTSYFILDGADGIQHMSTDGSAGWRRLKDTDIEYKRAKLAENYYSGNNPHYGKLPYDNGQEYFKYFRQLFKYSIDNDLIDPSCYDDIDVAMREIENVGFTGMTDENEDSKIHFFGNYLKKLGEGSFYTYIYTQSDKKKDGYQTTGRYWDVERYQFSKYNDNLFVGDNPYLNYTGDTVDDATNQIMNTKRVDIVFRLHSQWHTKEGQEEFKYLDDVVIPYLTQMIPSTAILGIRYVQR